jgi:hypothetical protein
MKYQITNQKDLRRAFWRDHPSASRKKSGDRYTYGQNRYCTDTRVAFVDYVDHCSRDGVISEALAQRATLEG